VFPAFIINKEHPFDVSLLSCQHWEAMGVVSEKCGVLG